MSILLNVLISAVGCLIAMFLFVFGLAIYDFIYESREENKRSEYNKWNF